MSSRPSPAGDTRSLADLVKELRDETILLLRQEVALAKSEMTEKASLFARNAVFLVAGAVVLLLAGVFALAALATGLYTLLDGPLGAAVALWLAPLLVAVLVAIVGAVLVLKARAALRGESAVPKQTVTSLQENTRWLARKIKS